MIHTIVLLQINKKIETKKLFRKSCKEIVGWRVKEEFLRNSLTGRGAVERFLIAGVAIR